MGATSRYGWPYPELYDPPNTAAHIKAALESVEATTGALDDTVAESSVLSDTPVTTNSALTSGTGKVIWVSRQVTLVGGKQYRVSFDTGWDVVAGSTGVFEMHYVSGSTATLTGATRFYVRRKIASNVGAYLAAEGKKTFVAPSSGTYTIMGVIWNLDSVAMKTNGGTPNGVDNTGVFIIERA
ncbi:hypothetical protein ACFORH_42950 [Amycolatopsis roodepoortensis]|uniref:Uncharacterized protein n=1 Tax=Amycolatopsis roodepoortensis TaxID=700274 RepID=A0ABR9L2T5_9PSEU|nr:MULTISPECIES: hypothetical protein [Amycolatopsis]MBE1575069.1 hypothetical protein [Amycolatopsis roodepoortensis]GHG97544.1 hypothetical protein GCM10017788_77130 [Amycolatopsis acidiphila]